MKYTYHSWNNAYRFRFSQKVGLQIFLGGKWVKSTYASMTELRADAKQAGVIIRRVTPSGGKPRK